MYILSHGDCYDGFGAAWAIQRGIAQDKCEDAVFLQVSYGQPMPEIPDGHEVVIADFSYPESELRALAARSYFVTVLDHHKTAQTDLRAFETDCPPNMQVTFDMQKSGAVLAWEEFVGGPVPQLLRYIQDRDLWTKALPFHDEIIAWIQSFPRTFEAYDRMYTLMEAPDYLGNIVAQGEAILRFKTQKVEEIAKHVRIQSLGGYANIPVVNSPYNFSSDVCHKLLEQFPEALFSAYYMTRGDGVIQWGLRSRPGFDCSVVAKQFGGGGHAQAAGFEIPTEVVS